MIRAAALFGLVLTTVWGGPADAAPTLTVHIDRSEVSAEAGSTVQLPVTITNEAEEPTGALVAHLLVVDPLAETSADAEDWTDQLTRQLDSLDPGESIHLEWDVKPIKSGEYFVMIAVAPLDPAVTPPTVSPNIVFTVSPPSGLTSASVIAVSLFVPLALVGTDLMIRRRQRSIEVPVAIGRAPGT